jgi:hypothetical protein
MKKTIENKHYIANLLTIAMGCGITKMMQDTHKQKGTLSKTFYKHTENAYKQGLQTTKTFSPILTPQGEKKAEKKLENFKKRYLHSASSGVLLSLCLDILETLYKKKKPNNTDVLEEKQKEELDKYIKKLLTLTKYTNRDLCKFSECKEAKELGAKWWEVIYE